MGGLREHDCIGRQFAPLVSPDGLSLRIPHPLAYIVQKTLIRPARQGEGKQAKDHADAFQLLAGLRQAWGSWGERVLAWRRQGQHGSWLDQALRRWEVL
jgi:hypothetical protein